VLEKNKGVYIIFGNMAFLVHCPAAYRKKTRHVRKAGKAS